MRLDKAKISLCVCGFSALALLALVTHVTPTTSDSESSRSLTPVSPALTSGGTLVPKRVRLIIGFQQTMPA